MARAKSTDESGDFESFGEYEKDGQKRTAYSVDDAVRFEFDGWKKTDKPTEQSE